MATKWKDETKVVWKFSMGKETDKIIEIPYDSEFLKAAM